MVLGEDSERCVHFLLYKLKNNSQVDCGESVVKVHYQWLFGAAYRILQTTQEAEDAVQDALCCANRHLHEFRGDASLRTWLYRIVINCAKNRRRANLRNGKFIICRLRQIDDSAHPVLLLPAPHWTRPDWLLHNQDCYCLLLQAVRKLPRRSAKMIFLRYWCDYSYELISKKLNCPIGTVKSTLSRLRKQLCRELREQIFPKY